MVEWVIDVSDHNGIPVRCSVAAWEQKIEANHPELIGRASAVRRTITRPDRVSEDRDQPDRMHFVRRLSRAGTFLDVVVEYAYESGDVEGRVVTAFERERLRAGDVIVYARMRKRR